MIIRNVSKNTVIAEKCEIADNFLSRFLGLMFKNELPEGNGLLITPCNSIHMFFMKFPLDIIFIDKEYNIVHLIENIKPWKFSEIIWSSNSVIELPTGAISKTRTAVGDRLEQAQNNI